MNSFLSEVAQALYERHGQSVSSCTMIFPSRRARLFFLDALSQVSPHPLWQPHQISIDDIFSELSQLEAGERVRLISELYKIYSKYHDESFDRFYFWGEILLSDFDMIDKYMVDAAALFRNAADIKEIEADISYLSEEQLKIVAAFWSSLGDKGDMTKEKLRFLKIWRSLLPIYNEFRSRLLELGIAYSGMIQRHAIERLKAGGCALDSSKRYVVVGFNALSKCEQRLFAMLSTATEVEFFWDYDNYYTHNAEQEAGMFIRDNIHAFPSTAAISHDNFRREKQIYSVATISNAMQCKYVATIIDQIAGQEKIDKNTAIVLTDENLLLPLLYSLPEHIGGVNVTMGYPLRLSLAYAFLERLVELQQHRRKESFYHQDVVGLLSHPYLQGAHSKLCGELIDEINRQRLISVEASLLSRGELLETIFSPCEGSLAISEYILRVIHAVVSLPATGGMVREMREFLSYMGDEISTLHNSISACGIELSDSIYISLLRRHLQTLRIPFEGEPLEGIQVMGILETRALDFRNVILLSMSDDNFPGNRTSQPSFVPQSLRAAYSLPTPEHHEGVFGYYFYRLIQRAERVWMLYSSHADEKSTGEPSRYIYQLDYESEFAINRISVGVDVALVPSDRIVIEKRGIILEELARYTAIEEPKLLSPTALFRYIACPMRFYLYSLAGVREDDELSDELDASMFGNILHGALETIYEPYTDTSDIASCLKRITPDEISHHVEKAINEHFLKCSSAKSEDYSGNVLLIKEIVCKYIRNGVLSYDIKNGDFVVESLEQEFSHPFPLPSGERVVVGGVVDRLDRLPNGSLRVVDYKSSQSHLEFKSLEDLFNGEAKFRLSNIIQTMIYSMILTKQRGVSVTPSLYYVRSMHRDDFSPLLIDRSRGDQVIFFDSYLERFEELITEKLRELFDPSIPFTQCEDSAHTCAYCDYRAICKIDRS